MAQFDYRLADLGGRFLGGMDAVNEQKRQNALLEMQQKQFGLNERKIQAELDAIVKSRAGRAAFLREFGFPEDLADDPDAPELIVELAKIKAGKAGGNIGNANPGDYTPESFEKWRQTGNYSDLVRVWAPINPGVHDVAGVPTQFSPVPRSIGGAPSANQPLPAAPQAFPFGGGATPTMQPYEPAPRPAGNRPLSTLAAEANAAQVIKEAEGVGSVRGQETEKRRQKIEDKLAKMVNSDELLNMAGPLVQVSTGSLVGAGVDKLANVFGFSPRGDEAIGALQVIAAGLLENVPRMEGPQSDADRVQYERAAGDLANPLTPKSKRMEAIRQIRAINNKYRALNSGATRAAPTRTVVRTGTSNGRKVVQYSDGTIEYAD